MTDAVTPLVAGSPIGDLINGKLHGRDQLFDTTGTDAMGLVVDAPAPLTLLGRLKAIASALAGALNVRVDGVADAALTANWAPSTPIVTTGYGAVIISVSAIAGSAAAVTVTGSLTGTTQHPLTITSLADNSQLSSITGPGLYQVTAAGSVSYALAGSGSTATVNAVLKR